MPQGNIKLNNYTSYKRNNSFNRNDSFDLLNFGPKSSQTFLKNLDFLPQLPSFNSGKRNAVMLCLLSLLISSTGYQISLTNGNNGNASNNPNSSVSQTANNEEVKPARGRNFLNGVLSNALNSDSVILSVNDLLGIDHNLSVRIFC